jgi:putative Mg2+ transporter-C (MgtC) family protein
MLPPDIYDYLIKILLSIILGSLIGIERELSHHWAGLRTHILVCLGSTLFMFITTFEYVNPQSGVTLSIDATRLAAGVITGIGFLGAGVIFREGASVKGLTTAASIWVTSSVGLLVGIAKYELAIIATLLIMIVLYSDMFLEQYVFKEQRRWMLNLSIRDDLSIQAAIEGRIRAKGIKLYLKDFKRRNKCISFIYVVTLPKQYPKAQLTKRLLLDKNVLKVSWTR